MSTRGARGGRLESWVCIVVAKQVSMIPLLAYSVGMHYLGVLDIACGVGFLGQPHHSQGSSEVQGHDAPVFFIRASLGHRLVDEAHARGSAGLVV